MLAKSDEPYSIPARTAVIDFAIIASLWCISLIVVNPFGDFPLNDDWSYGLTVKRLVENGDFRPPGWASIPLITNVAWGSLFCIPAGFSFTALRLSTLTLSLAAILGGYLLMKDLGQPRWVAIIATLTLAFNPIYYALSNTFMTDVPYTAIVIFSALFFARNLRGGSDLDLLIGTTLAVAATLSRQSGISVPLAFAVTLILTRGLTKRNVVRAAIPLALCLGTLLALQQWLTASGRLPALYHVRTEEFLFVLGDPKILVRFLAYNSSVSLLYLGLFLLPVLIVAVADILRSHRKQTIGLLAFTIAATVLLYGKGRLMPMSHNILVRSGIGPLTLRDTYILGLDHVPPLPTSLWAAVTAMGLLGAQCLVVVLAVRAASLMQRPRLGGNRSDSDVTGMFFLLIAMIYMLPLLAGNMLDRYFIPTIPFIAAGIAGVSGHLPRFRLVTTRTFRFAAAVLLATFSLFAIGGTRDYLAWNRARWEALHDLVTNDHVSVKDIDGGFEFNGLHLYDPRYQQDPSKSYWWVQGDAYQIGFGDIPGYEVIKEYRYANWMPPRVGRVLVLQKNPQPP